MIFKDWWGKEHSLPKNKTVTWRPSTYGLIIKDERILLIKSKFSNLWELPGGGVEIDETILEALSREVYEETGYKIIVKNKQPLYIEDNYFYTPNLDEYYRAIPMVFKAEPKGSNKNAKPTHNKEVAEVKWFDLDKLPKPMNSIATNAIKKYKE